MEGDLAQHLIYNCMARKKEIRKLREPIPTIIGAGITEKWYFRHLKDYAHLSSRSYSDIEDNGDTAEVKETEDAE